MKKKKTENKEKRGRQMKFWKKGEFLRFEVGCTRQGKRKDNRKE